jgi:hypothetical protein
MSLVDVVNHEVWRYDGDPSQHDAHESGQNKTKSL